MDVEPTQKSHEPQGTSPAHGPGAEGLTVCQAFGAGAWSGERIGRTLEHV
jgi:hypothetical protein